MKKFRNKKKNSCLNLKMMIEFLLKLVVINIRQEEDNREVMKERDQEN